jgi:molybdopterin-guanine dinucleotide biosynthesis protein A
MGRDKALLPWGDTDLLGHALARLRAVTEDVRILCGPKRRYEDRNTPLVLDRVEAVGPIAGILAGLESADGRAGLFLAVDMPGVPVGLLSRLAEVAEGYDAVVPASPRGPEPLCAVYAPSCLEPLRLRIAGRDLRMATFWSELRTRVVDREEVRRFGDPEAVFQNVNAPEDLERP